MAEKSEKKERKPPVSIPLDFDTAVGGLLAVDPKKLKGPQKKTAAKKKRPVKKK